MGNVWNEQRAFWQKNHKNQPIMPKIDFSKYSVIWYVDRGSNAGFVDLKEVLEYADILEIKVKLGYSDFGSSRLNLWSITKSNKKISFVEIREYEKGQ